MRPARGVTFDFGQTLADLDTAMLSRRLAEKSLHAPAERLEAAVAEAWRVYNDAIRRGLGGHPWKLLMSTLLAGGGVAEIEREAAVDWLWSEQPARNLWRRPIPDMIQLVRDLVAAGVPVGVVSNSEGRLAELAAELGWAELFPVLADSGKLGVEKPGREIFAWAADRLHLPLEDIVHIGDALAADVMGALGAGMRAIWYRGDPSQPLPERAARGSSAAEVRLALERWGIEARR